MTDAPAPEQIRDWLRANATIVKPGETLVIQADRNATPNQIREWQDVLNQIAGFRVLVVPGASMGVAERSPGDDFATRVAESLAHPLVADALHMALLRASIRRGPDAPAQSPGDAP